MCAGSLKPKSECVWRTSREPVEATGQLDRPKPMVGYGRLGTHLNTGLIAVASMALEVCGVPLRGQEYGLRRTRSIRDTIDGKSRLVQAAYRSGYVAQIKPESHPCRTFGTAYPVGRTSAPGTGSLVGSTGGVDRVQHVSALLSAHCQANGL